MKPNMAERERVDSPSINQPLRGLGHRDVEGDAVN